MHAVHTVSRVFRWAAIATLLEALEPAVAAPASDPASPTPPAISNLVRPSIRYSAGAAFDRHRNVLVLFGGYANEPLGDTWEWNGSEWRLATLFGPGPRNSPGLAYDAARRVVVMFGGNDPGGYFGDTWEWDGSRWSLKSFLGPAPRTLHRMVYDASRGRVVMFGGLDATSCFGDLWEWDGQAWHLISDDGPARFLFGMAYDSSASHLVVYGGITSAEHTPGHESGGTWTRSTAGWDSVATDGPGVRDHVTIAHDETRGRTVFYGGAYNGQVYDELWEFDGTSWTERPFTGGPGPRSFPQLVYDSNAGAIVLFGGFDHTGPYNDLWSWSGSQWRRLDDKATPVLVRSFDVVAAERGLTVRWDLSGAAGEVAVERASAEVGPWTTIALVPSTQGAIVDAEASTSGSWWYRLRVASDGGAATVFGPVHWAPDGVDAFLLGPIAPNPGAPPLTVSLAVPRAARIRVTVVDAQGRHVATLADSEFPAGRHAFRWNGMESAPGMYFVRAEALGHIQHRRFAMVR